MLNMVHPVLQFMFNMKPMKLTLLPLLGFGLIVFPSPSALADEPSVNLQLARQLNQAFVEVAEKVTPAVVVITVVQRPGAFTVDDEESGSFEGLPREFRDQLRRRRQEEPREWQQGQGSGVIIRPDGFILTNGHVVEEAESIQVRLQDGRTYKAKVRGVDAQSDVAIIKIEARDLPTATLADSTKTRVGEFAIAIGAPFSLDYSVTFGHVSAKGRSNILPMMAATAMADQDFIQTDANINPGNSGGPLVNIEGEVIGINTLIRGLHTGIGFAIPSSLAKEVSDQLITDGKFTRAWLGIGIRALREDPDFRERLKGVQDGVVVMRIIDEGPAGSSDLKRQDIITAVEGKPVSTPQELRSEVRTKKIGQPITLDVFRPDKSGSGTTIKVKIKPAEWQEPDTTLASTGSELPPSSSGNPIGVSVDSWDPELAKNLLGAEATPGVIVVAVEKGKLGDRHGIKPGDVITTMDRQPVATAKQFREALKKANLKKGVALNLISGDTKRLEILKNDE
jgi:serine protease Do